MKHAERVLEVIGEKVDRIAELETWKETAGKVFEELGTLANILVSEPEANQTARIVPTAVAVIQRLRQELSEAKRELEAARAKTNGCYPGEVSAGESRLHL
jgi:hypothetical protein